MPWYKRAREGADAVFTHPITGVLLDAETGGEWPNDQYTKRRVRDGDIVATDTPAASETDESDPNPPTSNSQTAAPQSSPTLPSDRVMPSGKPSRER